jgi:hypothetical protein
MAHPRSEHKRACPELAEGVGTIKSQSKQTTRLAPRGPVEAPGIKSRAEGATLLPQARAESEDEATPITAEPTGATTPIKNKNPASRPYLAAAGPSGVDRAPGE